ncbi:T9SS type A sorting domain-containing protein, partial [Aestuariivivens sediminicola]|uniref:T9SS type A sorting domain-containing protein n=1 Tax=Aestuariivivens sediminicola TaxID=2913560 RepID=UPI001F5777E9
CDPQLSNDAGEQMPDACGDSITVTWTITDTCIEPITASATFTIVPDLEKPVITCPEPMTICMEEFPTEWAGGSWSDNCDGTGPLSGVKDGEMRYSEDGCAQLQDYKFMYTDSCGNSAMKICTITREIDKYDNCETAFAMDMETASCFIPSFKRWGWTNHYDEGDISELPLYAGAAQCDVSKGALVGSVTVDYSQEGEITVTYAIDNDGIGMDYAMSEAHVYVGCDMYPEKNGTPTVAPGQYTFNAGSLDHSTGISVTFTNVSGPVYVIAHAVTCEELCRCSDRPGVDDGNTYTVDLGIDCGEGAKEAITKAVDFLAYPVPFDQEVNIKYSFDYDTDVNIEVFDIKGALIRSSENTQYIKGTVDSSKIDLSGTDNQMFFVRLTTKEGTMIKKIVSSSPQ